ncbi:hypothetical protein [Gordonia iterans]
MTESLKTRADRTGQERAARCDASPMTCDVPVVLSRSTESWGTESAGCLTTGRSPQTHRRAVRLSANTPIRTSGTGHPGGAHDVSGSRSNTGRSNTGRSNTGSPKSGRSNSRRSERSRRARHCGLVEHSAVAPAIARRRRWAAGLLLGVGCAVVVAVLGVVGEDYSDAATGAPAATEVVHVRSGESLAALAARIAPEEPTAAVIATVRELNDLQTAGLRPGQALLVPAYR